MPSIGYAFTSAGRQRIRRPAAGKRSGHRGDAARGAPHPRGDRLPRARRGSALLARLDAVVLHPVAGPVLLAAVLFLMFQAVFSWAKAPHGPHQRRRCSHWARYLASVLPAGPLRSLLLDGVVAGAGSVLVFLPQILILFLFILALEDSGYLPRAAFLLDRLMGRVGLSGRAFIPLLVELRLRDSRHHGRAHHPLRPRPPRHHHDRAAHDLLGAAAGVCAAIGAFIPQRSVGIFNLQGLVLFALYLAGVAAHWRSRSC